MQVHIVLPFIKWKKSTRGRFEPNMTEKQTKMLIFPLAVHPQGGHGCQNNEKTTGFKFLCSRCDHEVLKELEAKNSSKMGIFDQIWLFLRRFWLLAPLKLHGHY